VRVLVCSTDAPLPPLTGARLQLFHVLEQLRDRHEITVVGVRWPDQDGAAPAGVELVETGLEPSRLRRNLRRTRALTAREPLPVAQLGPLMLAAVRQQLARRDFDVALVHGSPLARLRPALGELPAALVALDAEYLNVAVAARVSRGMRRAAERVNEASWRRTVRRHFHAFERVVVVSAEDAAALRDVDPRIRTAVIPNGVDSEHFHPGELARDDGLVVFTGTMDWPPNVEAAQFLAGEVAPRLRARVPAAKLALVGRSPSPSVQALAGPGVEVTGEVPDVRPWLWRAQAFACPMVSGTGIKNKLLEALACGAPAVATPRAMQGLGAAPGREVLVAEGADGFAAAVADVLTDAELRARLARGGREYVAAHHSWAAAAAAFEALCREIALAHPAGRTEAPVV